MSDDKYNFFENQYLSWKKYFVGEVDRFKSLFQWVEPPYHWILIARVNILQGKRKIFAYPYACVGGEEFSETRVQQMLKVPYTRIQLGWVRSSDLQTLGINDSGILKDGTPLKPVELDASLLLHRGGKSLDTIFSSLILDGEQWVDQGDKYYCINSHFRFLTHWGINYNSA